jgi:hypothetical protein
MAASPTCLYCELSNRSCPADIKKNIWHDSSCISPDNYYCPNKKCSGKQGSHSSGCWRAPNACSRCHSSDGTHKLDCVPRGICRSCKQPDGEHKYGCTYDNCPVCSMCSGPIWGSKCDRCENYNHGSHVSAAFRRDAQKESWAKSKVKNNKQREAYKTASQWLKDWTDTAGG